MERVRWFGVWERDRDWGAGEAEVVRRVVVLLSGAEAEAEGVMGVGGIVAPAVAGGAEAEVFAAVGTVLAVTTCSPGRIFLGRPGFLFTGTLGSALTTLLPWTGAEADADAITTSPGLTNLGLPGFLFTTT